MEYLFKENQKFTQWWLWVILLSFPIMSFGPFDDNKINILHVIIGFSLPIIFYILELRIRVNNDGLHYQFFPLHLRYFIIKIEDIEKIEAMKYKPISEYGGWGIKYGFKGKAYNVSGNLGVKVFLKNGSNIMFGSQNYKSLARSLSNLINNN